MSVSSSRDIDPYTVYLLKSRVKELIDGNIVEKTKEERLSLMDRSIARIGLCSSPFSHKLYLELIAIKTDMNVLFLTKKRKNKIRKSLTSMLNVLIDTEYRMNDIENIKKSLATIESFKSKQEEKPDKTISSENIDKTLEKVKEYREQGYKIKIEKTSKGKINVYKIGE